MYRHRVPEVYKNTHYQIVNYTNFNTGKVICVPKSKSTFRLESFAKTDDATRLILFTVTKSLPHPIPLTLLDPETIPPSFINLDGVFCDVILGDCIGNAIGNEQGPPANA